MRNIFLLFIVAIVLFSCKKKETELPDMHYDYVPFKKGIYQIYNVLERSYLSDGTRIEKQYQLKTMLTDTIIDNEQRENRQFVRFKRDNALQNWVAKDVWMAYKSKQNFQLVEENERLVKVSFPVRKSHSWDINAYNVHPKQMLNYNDLFQSKTINGFVFPETITVLQEKEKNLIMFRNKYEIYAKNVGLVYKYYQHLDISNFDTTNIRSGKEIFYTIVSFGVE